MHTRSPKPVMNSTRWRLSLRALLALQVLVICLQMGLEKARGLARKCEACIHCGDQREASVGSVYGLIPISHAIREDTLEFPPPATGCEHEWMIVSPIDPAAQGLGKSPVPAVVRAVPTWYNDLRRALGDKGFESVDRADQLRAVLLHPTPHPESSCQVCAQVAAIQWRSWAVLRLLCVGKPRFTGAYSLLELTTSLDLVHLCPGCFSVRSGTGELAPELK